MSQDSGNLAGRSLPDKAIELLSFPQRSQLLKVLDDVKAIEEGTTPVGPVGLSSDAVQLSSSGDAKGGGFYSTEQRGFPRKPMQLRRERYLISILSQPLT